MPQLDKFAFFSQIFWLTIVFVLFYYFIVNYILPGVIRIFLVRKFILKASENNSIDNISLSLKNFYTYFIDLFLNTLTKNSINYQNFNDYYNLNSINSVYLNLDSSLKQVFDYSIFSINQNHYKLIKYL